MVASFDWLIRLVDLVGGTRASLAQPPERRDQTGQRQPGRHRRARRLTLARERLRRPGPQTVSEVALDCGFWELGRFAQAYRAAYGERPSETLRRRTG